MMSDSSRNCGHPPNDLESMVLGCAHPLCDQEPTISVVSISPSLGERPCWRIAGACDRHASMLEEAARTDPADHPEAGPRRMSTSVQHVLDWIHSDGRCNLDCVSVAQS